jgi:hypothetical protein
MRIVYFALLAGSLLTGRSAMGADMDWSKVDQALDKTETALSARLSAISERRGTMWRSRKCPLLR